MGALQHGVDNVGLRSIASGGAMLVEEIAARCHVINNNGILVEYFELVQEISECTSG